MALWRFQGPRGLVGPRGPPGPTGQPVSQLSLLMSVQSNSHFIDRTALKETMASNGKNKYGLYSDCLLLAPFCYPETF